MNKSRSDQEKMKGLAEFVEAPPVSPRRKTDEAIFRLVRKDLRPAPWRVLAKCALVQTAAGVVTLGVCPQFDIGFGSHNAVLHDFHATANPFVFYLSCGFFFVLLGAIVSALVLNRAEIKAIGRSKYLYFAVYSVGACAVFSALGAKVILVATLAWVLGALLGHLFGFAAGTRLRRATA